MKETVKTKGLPSSFKLPIYFFSICYLLLSLWFFTARVQFFCANLPGNRIIKLFYAVCICVIAVLFVAVWPKIKKLCMFFINAVRKTPSKRLLLITVFFCFILKLIFLFALQIDSTNQEDCKYYWSFIQQLTENGHISHNTEYATMYFYTVLYAVFFLPVTKIFGAKDILICNAYLVVLFTVASVLLYDTLKYRFGKNYAFTAVLIWNVFPAGIMQPLFLCHENALILFHILTIWLLFRVLPSVKSLFAKALTVTAAAAVITFASAINQFGNVSIIAIIIISVLFGFKKEKLVKSVAGILALILIFSAAHYAMQTATSALKDKIVDPYESAEYENRLDFGWTLYTGASYDYRGACNDEDYKTYFKYAELSSREDALNYQKSLLKNRYKEYLHNPVRFITHLNNKMMVMSKAYYPLSFSRGINYGRSRISSFIYNSFNGYLNYAIEGVLSLINIAAAFVLLMSFRFKSIPKQTDLHMYLKLFMLGVCGILLFVEVSSKYASVTLFVYLTVMTLQLKDFMHNMDSLKQHIRLRFNK